MAKQGLYPPRRKGLVVTRRFAGLGGDCLRVICRGYSRAILGGIEGVNTLLNSFYGAREKTIFE